MPRPLNNITIAILEHRYTKEFSALFERFGAHVYACPLLEEKPVENREELREFIGHVLAGNLDLMIFLTGVGARFLISEAESMGAKDSFIAALNRLTIVVRGPKPVAALRQFGIRIDVIPATPTTEGVIEALQDKDLGGKRAGVQLYGTPNPQLVTALQERGAAVSPVQVYAYGAAADSSAVGDLIREIVKGRIGLVAFTSAPQVRMLFDLAAQIGQSEPLRHALKNNVTIASIGEVTSRALAENGLTPEIVPQQSKMGALAQTVADFYAQQ